MILGIDYIGGANYPDTIAEWHPAGFAAGFLCRAAGWPNGMIAAEALAVTGKCKVMRIHGIWRDNHCFNEGDIAPAVTQAKKVAELAYKYPNITLYYSPWLEHRAPRDVFQQCRAACREVLPKRVRIVSSGTKVKGIYEVHHSLPSGGDWFFSFDGADMYAANVPTWKELHEGAILFMGWIPRCNGKLSMSDDTPRPERSAWLRQSDFERMRQELQGR